MNKTIHSLGKKGEIITVDAGYGRNYLIPNKIASEATKGMCKSSVELKKQSAHKQDQLKKDAHVLVEKILNLKLEIKARAGSAGRIFGGITTTKISEALSEKGIHVDKHNIILTSVVKELGRHKALLKLYEGVECELQFSVILS